MTDNEIIKALEEMVDYPHNYEEGQDLKNVLDLINRLKAEIEELNGSVKSLEDLCETKTTLLTDANWSLITARTETVKEFLNKARERSYESSDWSYGEQLFVVEWDDLVAIYEEMVGEG